jgi:phenylpyruvate tautomerase PptA (4-oxalocrotonate tautomerase family)
MPLIKISLDLEISPEKRAKLHTEACRIVAAGTGKPEVYTMVVCDAATIAMGGGTGNAIFADVRAIRLGGNVAAQLAKELCALFESLLGVPPKRVYLNFTEVPANQWGWNGETCG